MHSDNVRNDQEEGEREKEGDEKRQLVSKK
jgi:hypothetical protein